MKTPKERTAMFEKISRYMYVLPWKTLGQFEINNYGCPVALDNQNFAGSTTKFQPLFACEIYMYEEGVNVILY